MTPALKMANEKALKPHKGKREAVWYCGLNEMRNKLRLTLRDVEKGTGVSNATICHMEQGADPTLSNARKVADFFGVKIDDIWPNLIGWELRKK